MADVSVTMGNMTTLAKHGTTVLRAIDRAQSVYDAIQLVHSIYDIVHDGRWRMAIRIAVENAKGELAGKIRPGRAMDIDIEETVETLLTNLPRVMSKAFPVWSSWLGSNIKKVDSYLLYLPSPGLMSIPSKIGGSLRIPTGLKIGNTPVQLAMPGKKKWGTVIGMGLYAPHTSGYSSEQQIWRMDYHDWNDTHGGSSLNMADASKEISVWRDGNLHFHVMRPQS